MSDGFPLAFGRYELIERLAVGGMAELYKARVVGAHGFTKTVVIKKILPHLAADLAFVAMFIDEAKITSRLDHPKIAQVLELGTIDEQLYIAMEFVDGLDALGLLRGCVQRKQLLPPALAVHVAREVLDALDYAHHAKDEGGHALGIVHRDVSPSNVLLSRRGDVKLADFGIAHAVERQQQTQAGALKGKYGYMSPEQVVGSDLDGRSDLFSLAIVLAEMLMGRRLFVAQNDLDLLLMVRDVQLDRLNKFGRTLDRELRELLLKALQKDPKDRFESAALFRDSLDEWLFFRRQRVTASDLALFLTRVFGDDLPRPLQPPTPGQAVADQAQMLLEVPLAEPDESEPASSMPVSLPSRPLTPVTRRAPYTLKSPSEGSLVLAIDDEPDAPVLLNAAESRRLHELLSATNPFDLLIDDDPPLVAGSQGGKSQEADFFDVSAELGLEPSVVPRMPTAEEAARAPVPAPPTLGIVGELADEEGDFMRTAPVRILYRLAVEKANGLLVVESSDVTKEIYLVGGVPEFVSSNDAGELLGEYLVSRGIVTRPELQTALAMMPHFGGKLGDTFVGLGLLKPLDVFRLLTQQVREKIIQVCGWQGGRYRWYSGKRNPRSAFPLGLDAFEVLGAGISALYAQTVDSWAKPLLGRVPLAAKHPRVVPEAFRLGSHPREVYNRLDGRRTLREYSLRFVDEDERVAFLRTLYLLVNTDLAFFQ